MNKKLFAAALITAAVIAGAWYYRRHIEMQKVEEAKDKQVSGTVPDMATPGIVAEPPQPMATPTDPDSVNMGSNFTGMNYVEEGVNLI